MPQPRFWHRSAANNRIKIGEVEMAKQLENITAPDFTLVDHEGRTVRLAEARGKNVVLIFNRSLQ
jgi:cytochrome oxidase Cu insertion factor (SCO1/SenC/PrrC family)